jgi:hypothetical protein
MQSFFSLFHLFLSTQFLSLSARNAGLPFYLLKSILLLLLPVMFFFSFYDRVVFSSSLILVVPPLHLIPRPFLSLSFQFSNFENVPAGARATVLSLTAGGVCVCVCARALLR